MSALIFILSCTFAVLGQNMYGQCQLHNSYNGSCGGGLSYGSLISPYVSSSCGAVSDGSGFLVTSASPTPPSGVSVLSENEYAGILTLTGQVPFLGTTYLEGSVPSKGAGSVTYGCGNDKVAIVSEEGSAFKSFTGSTFANFPGIISPWVADVGYNRRNPCGCGRKI